MGRWLWVLFARQIYAVPEPTIPVVSVILVGVGALVLANVVAAIPASRGGENAHRPHAQGRMRRLECHFSPRPRVLHRAAAPPAPVESPRHFWDDDDRVLLRLPRGNVLRTRAINGSAMTDFVMTVGGETIPTGDSFGVRNPATGEVFARAPECGKEQLDAAFDAASKALRDWKNDESTRRAALLKVADVLMASAGEIAPVLTSEQGKPLADANIEVFAAAIWCQYFANLETPPQIIQDDEQAFVEVVRRPLGVVAAITPWNFPLTLAFWKIAPALLAGNTMVLKPSPFTPLSTLQVGALLRDVLPPGVLNVVSGGDGLGALMTGHPVPRKISFTGSIETGKKVAAAAAPDLKRVTLELGVTTRQSFWTTPTRLRWPPPYLPARSTTTVRSARPSSGCTYRRPCMTRLSMPWQSRPRS